MNHIFIDFEMHPVAREFKEERGICAREIIEIGAVMLDENFSEIASFKKYVRPEYVKDVYTKISVLTGITKNMLMGADTFNIVFLELVEWCNSFDDEITIYAWSQNDLSQLTKEMALKNTPITEEVSRMLNNWVDFQKDYCELVHAERLLSLDKALNTIGQYFLGNMHDALYDARNTAELFSLTRDKDEFYRMLKPITDTIRNSSNEKFTFTLGDIFNFDLCKFEFA